MDDGHDNNSIGENNGQPSVDWYALEIKFKELLGLLNTPFGSLSGMNSSLRVAGPGVQEERQRHLESLELGLIAIIDVALSESTMLLHEGDNKGAIAGGLKTLQFVQDLYGPNSIQQVEPYFLLSKAHQALKHYQQAEEFLGIANWTIMKNTDPPNHIKAELHQNFGLLYVNKGEIDKAIEHLATSSYYLALIHGTEHLITTYGYFNLGNVFASQDKMDKAIDFLRKVVDIWAKQLLLAITRERQRAKDEDDEANAESAPTPDLKDRDETKLELEELDEEKIFEANHMFEHILNIEMQRYGENHIETGKVFQVYGLYQYWIGEVVKARDCLEKACNIMKYVLGENHSSTREIRQLIEQISM